MEFVQSKFRSFMLRRLPKKRERERERVEQAAPTLQNQMVCLLIKKLHPKRTFIIKVMLTDTLRVKVNKMKYLILFFFFFTR